MRTPIHSGAILADELEEIGVSAVELARLIEVPENRVSQIIAEKRGITAYMARRLAQYFGMSAELWMNLQKMYEFELARRQTGKVIKHIPQRPKVEAPAFDRK